MYTIDNMTNTIKNLLESYMPYNLLDDIKKVDDRTLDIYIKDGSRFTVVITDYNKVLEANKEV